MVSSRRISLSRDLTAVSLSPTPHANPHPPTRSSSIARALTDNTATVDIVKSLGASGKSKHFERWVTYVRDLYQRFIITVKHLGTDKMPADIFTKALPRESFALFRSILLGY